MLADLAGFSLVLKIFLPPSFACVFARRNNYFAGRARGGEAGAGEKFLILNRTDVGKRGGFGAGGAGGTEAFFILTVCCSATGQTS